MTKQHRITIIVLIFIAFLVWLIPNAVRGQQIAHIQKQIARNSADRNHCEQVQLSGHDENKKLNEKLDKLLGRSSFTSGVLLTPNDQTATGAIQAVDQFIE